MLWSSVRVENERLLTGYRITSGWARENYQYFAIEFSKPIVKYGYKDKEKKKYTGFWRKFNQFENFPEMAGQGICAYFEFGNIDSLTLKVALSAENPQKTVKFMIPGSKIGSVRYNGPSDNALADKGVYVIAANQSTGTWAAANITYPGLCAVQSRFCFVDE